MVMVAKAFGIAVLLAWLVIAAVAGGLMLRHHKMAVAWSLFDDLRRGEVKRSSLFWVARYYISAVLLLLPGLLGDVIALILLLPWRSGPAGHVPPTEGVIEGDYRRVDHQIGPDRQIRP